METTTRKNYVPAADEISYFGSVHDVPDPYARTEYAQSIDDIIDLDAAPEHPRIDRAAQIAHDTVDKAADAAAPAADWLNEKSAGARVKQKQWLADARVYVSANPMKGVGIAAAIGLVIGLIL